MKTIVELNDSLLEEIKHHAARHHTTLRAVLEHVPHHFLKRWTTTPFRMRRATCSGSSPQAGIQEENWNPIRSRIHERKANNRSRYQFGREIFDAARQEFLAPALRQGPPRDKLPR